jgi:aryl-alcohol dehydrogenase-like predicted oxidoreductase
MDQGNGATVHPIIGLRSTDHLADNARTVRLRLDSADRAAIEAVLAEGTRLEELGDVYSFERRG